MQKALIYCRVSSERQKPEGHGLESQEHRCREFAGTKGYEIEKVFRDSFSGGGGFTKRPAMSEMLEYMDSKPYNRYVVLVEMGGIGYAYFAAAKLRDPASAPAPPAFDSSARSPKIKTARQKPGIFILVEMGGIEPPCKKDSAGLLRSVVSFDVLTLKYLKRTKLS